MALGDVWSNDLIKNTKETAYDTAKPEELLRLIVEAATKPGDIVLDFFLGSGTTAAVAIKLNRIFIGIEQLEGGLNTIIPRLQNVIGKISQKENEMFDEIKYDQKGISKSVNWHGGGDFIYCELMKYNQVFMDKIQATGSSEELIELWAEIAANSFLNWYVNPQVPDEAVNDFIKIGKTPNGLDKQKKLLAELLNKNQLYVNLSEIDDDNFNVSREDKKLNQLFFGEAYHG